MTEESVRAPGGGRGGGGGGGGTVTYTISKARGRKAILQKVRCRTSVYDTQRRRSSAQRRLQTLCLSLISWMMELGLELVSSLLGGDNDEKQPDGMGKVYFYRSSPIN